DHGRERRRTCLHPDAELRALPMSHLTRRLPLDQILHVLGRVAIVVHICEHCGHGSVDGHVDGDATHMPGLLAWWHRDNLSMRCGAARCGGLPDPAQAGGIIRAGAPGSSSARLECTVRDREVGSSNLPFPTFRTAG